MNNERGKIIRAGVGASLSMLVLGACFLAVWGTGAYFAIGMLAGLGLFCVGFGMIPVRVSGELLLFEGIWVRIIGALAIAGIVWFIDLEPFMTLIH